MPQHTCDTTFVWRLLSKEAPRISVLTLYNCLKLQSLSYMFAADSTGLPVFLFAQLFSKIKELLDLHAQKQNLTRNSHSRSFKITSFGISGKVLRDSVSLHNNPSLIFKVSEDIASKNTEICRCRQPHCHLMPHVQGPTANIRINLILLKI